MAKKLKGQFEMMTSLMGQEFPTVSNPLLDADMTVPELPQVQVDKIPEENDESRN